MSVSTVFCFVRHGETDWNVERRYQGHLDIGLNAKGRGQAAAAAKGLKGQRFDLLYSSDLQRTRDTAAPLSEALVLPVHLEPGLRERHYGVFQGRTVAEVEQMDPEAHDRYHQRDPDFTFGDGESLKDFARRIENTVGRLARQHPGQRLLAIVHGGVLDTIYRRATGLDLRAPRDFLLPNAAFNWIEVKGDHWRVMTWADQQHLRGALDELA